MNDPTQALQALLQAGGATSAFAANSRYHAIATAKLTTADGKSDSLPAPPLRAGAGAVQRGARAFRRAGRSLG